MNYRDKFIQKHEKKNRDFVSKKKNNTSIKRQHVYWYHAVWIIFKEKNISSNWIKSLLKNKIQIMKMHESMSFYYRSTCCSESSSQIEKNLNK
jgi:hypothetical protein